MELTGGAILSVTAREGANCQRESEGVGVRLSC